MFPYFLDLQTRIISDKLSDALFTIAKDNIALFKPYIAHATNANDGNFFLRTADVVEQPEIVKIKNSCNLNFFPALIMHKPFTVLPKHIDDPNGRNCVLSTPIAPKNNYVATRFWQRGIAGPVAMCYFHNFNSVFLNTQQPHDLENVDVYRFNLQFCFNEPFETVVDLYQNGKLFNKQVDTNQ